MDLNNVAIIGRLVRDPELTFAQSGTEIAKFSIAVSSGYGDKKEVSFFDITAFKQTAKACSQYLKKGQQAAITGHLKQNSWTTKDGQKRSKIEIIASSVQFIGNGGKKEDAPVPEKHEPKEADTYEIDPETIDDENPF